MHVSLVLKIKTANRTLQLTERESNKIRYWLQSMKNSEDYASLKNQIEEQINDFLNNKKEIFKLAVTTIVNIIKEDPEKDLPH